MTVHALGITKDKQIAYATNGNETECTNNAGNCGCIHAEIALLKKLPNPEIVLVSHSPCLACAKALVQVNVKKVRYHIPYRLTEGIEYLKEQGVDIAISERGKDRWNSIYPKPK
jgi:deoxycytidylate deaminase